VFIKVYLLLLIVYLIPSHYSTLTFRPHIHRYRYTRYYLDTDSEFPRTARPQTLNNYHLHHNAVPCHHRRPRRRGYRTVRLYPLLKRNTTNWTVSSNSLPGTTALPQQVLVPPQALVLSPPPPPPPSLAPPPTSRSAQRLVPSLLVPSLL